MGMTGTEVTQGGGEDDPGRRQLRHHRRSRCARDARIFDNIRKFLRYLLSSNMGEVLTVFLGVVGAGVIGPDPTPSGALMLPLLATQILWINLLTDSGRRWPWASTRATDDVMARQPRRLTERVIDARMWAGRRRDRPGDGHRRPF